MNKCWLIQKGLKSAKQKGGTKFDIRIIIMFSSKTTETVPL